jgi:predicted PurR-regulated permease PerM
MIPITPIRVPFRLRLLGVALAFWLIVSYAPLILEVVGVLFGALLLSLAIAPLADGFARYRIPRGVTVLSVYLLGGGLLVALTGLLMPVIRSEFALIQSQGPVIVRSVADWLATLPGFGNSAATLSGSVSGEVGQQISAIAGSIVRALAGAGGLALSLLIVLVLTYLFSTDRGLVERLRVNWIVPVHQPRLLRVTERLQLRLTRWVWSQVLIALYFAVVYSIGLTLLGVPFAVSIGVVGGVLEIVPYLGGSIALVLAVISAVSVSPWVALWVVLFHIVVVELESHVIAPALYGKIIGVHPALLLIALFIGAKAGGILGIFFAVPVTVVILALIQELQRSAPGRNVQRCPRIRPVRPTSTRRTRQVPSNKFVHLLWAPWATGSTMCRRCTPPMWASRWQAP